MNQKRSISPMIWVGVGLVLLAVGFFALDDTYKSVAGLCIGIGAGLVGMNLANFLIERYYRRNPAAKKQSDIEANDERSQMITQKAKAKAYDWMVKVLIVVPFILILIDAPLWATLATIAVYLFGFVMQMVFIAQFNQEL